MWWLTQQLLSDTYAFISNSIFVPLQPRGRVAEGTRWEGPHAKEQDKLPQVQSICFEHQSLPPTMSLMQSGYTFSERERGKKRRKTRPSTEEIHLGRPAAY